MLLTADRIHDGHRFLPGGSVLEIADDGTVLAIHGAEKSSGAKHYSGVLTPGFVNAHCHLELSHMAGVIPEKTGLIPFLGSIPALRFGFSEEQRQAARHEAFAQLQAAGIVAVGDIANTTDALDLRASGKVHFHTFVESMGFTEAGAEKRFADAVATYEAYAAQEAKTDCLLEESIVPHAPYSVSQKLFGLIGAHGGGPLSIHNQESAAENEFYTDKSGAVNELLGGMGIDSSAFLPSGKGSLPTYIEWLPVERSLLFVHNTFTTAGDVELAQSRFQKAFWCLCPGANLYIEDRLPDVPALAAATEHLCIGTDSLASNHRLSILAELHILNESFPQIGWERLLRWATLNGARALHLEEKLGALEMGKRPGLLLLQPEDTTAGVQVIIPAL